jgi:hypothetical protein
VNLVVHHLLFTLEAQTTVHLGPQAGAQLRGALWAALEKFACTDPAARNQPAHTHYCPMCRLVALETTEGGRGGTPPRPFAIRPPLTYPPEADRYFEAGQSFSVGVNLFGDAADLFPYVVQAVWRMGEIGVGYGRGQFAVRRVQAINPLGGTAQDLFTQGRIVALPDTPIDGEQVRRTAETLSPERLRLSFLTPTQITRDGGRLCPRPAFDRLIARLLERCQALEQHYTDAPTPQPVWRERYLDLTARATEIRQVEDHTRWVELHSGSRRSGDRTSISGFVGEAVFTGDLAPFREWLLWGASLHVGKNAVKGDGWYALEQ